MRGRPVTVLHRVAVCAGTTTLVLLWVALGAVWAAPAPQAKAGSGGEAKTKPAPFRIKLTVPTAGWYVLWVRSDDPSRMVQPQRFRGKTASVDLDVEGSVRLHVLDEAGGVVARRDVKAGRGLEYDLRLASGDFTHAARVPVQVLSEGKAVASALVILRDANGEEQRRVLLPGQHGTVVFEDAALGRGSVEVRYGAGMRVVQDVDIAVTAGSPRTVSVYVAKAPHTEAVAPEKEPGKAAERRPEAKPSGGAGLTGYAVALGLVVFLVLLGYYLVRSGTVNLEALLGRFGVKAVGEQPAPEAEAPPVQVPPGVCPFCGAKRDPVTGACACTVAPGPAAAGPRLVVLGGAEAGRAYPLGKESMSLGRDAGNDIVISWDPAVSRRHAVVSVQSGGYMIADQGSSNGTFVNGVRIIESALQAGDVVTVGQTQLRFEL